jgi:DNA-directed RNA polymerase subunit RPC12/RpoP
MDGNMINWFNIILAFTVIAIILFIVNAIKKTKADTDKRFRGTNPSERERIMKKRMEEIRNRDIRCSRCGEQTFALLGTGNKYKCYTCNHVFDGPEHISSKID